jgi:hypothetical protein
MTNNIKIKRLILYKGVKDKMITLEQQLNKVNGLTCINQIRAMKEAYVPEEDCKCRNCNSYDYCPDYSPVNHYEIPLNGLRFNNGN